MTTQLEDYFHVLAPNDIRLQDTRIGIESILYEYLYHCKTPEEIAEQFHTVSLEQVYATILYYLQNQDRMGAYLKDWLEFSRKMRQEQLQNPSPARLKMRQLKAQQESKAEQEIADVRAR